MRKTKIIGLTAVAMIVVTITAVAGVIGLTRVSAALGSLGLHNGKIPTIITNLANRFNLNPTDIQTVFDQTRTQNEDTRLSQLVTDGKITEAQKKLIIDKRTEIEGKVAEINNKQMTASERKDALDTLRDDIILWASDNKIDESDVLMGEGMGRGFNFQGQMMRGGRGGVMGDR